MISRVPPPGSSTLIGIGTAVIGVLAALYGTAALNDAMPIPAADALSVIERAVPRPVTPVYSQLSEILQISVHRALTRQQEPAPALKDAAQSMRALLAKVQLDAAAP